MSAVEEIGGKKKEAMHTRVLEINTAREVRRAVENMHKWEKTFHSRRHTHAGDARRSSPNKRLCRWSQNYIKVREKACLGAREGDGAASLSLGGLCLFFFVTDSTLGVGFRGCGERRDKCEG